MTIPSTPLSQWTLSEINALTDAERNGFNANQTIELRSRVESLLDEEVQKGIAERGVASQIIGKALLDPDTGQLDTNVSRVIQRLTAIATQLQALGYDTDNRKKYIELVAQTNSLDQIIARGSSVNVAELTTAVQATQAEALLSTIEGILHLTAMEKKKLEDEKDASKRLNLLIQIATDRITKAPADARLNLLDKLTDSLQKLATTNSAAEEARAKIAESIAKSDEFKDLERRMNGKDPHPGDKLISGAERAFYEQVRNATATADRAQADALKAAAEARVAISELGSVLEKVGIHDINAAAESNTLIPSILMLASVDNPETGKKYTKTEIDAYVDGANKIYTAMVTAADGNLKRTTWKMESRAQNDINAIVVSAVEGGSAGNGRSGSEAALSLTRDFTPDVFRKGPRRGSHKTIDYENNQGAGDSAIEIRPKEGRGPSPQPG